ncbi:KCTD1_15 [Mytilus coruscus]|uniref:KCTD1_15 n=1 Tax=Mytilus coruscus TaxID=42192 RepID=A0A6J8AKF3_MYTCO|nr:KCTD1_15 [Mytilus coruscus]
MSADKTIKQNIAAATIFREYLKEKKMDPGFEHYDTLKLDEALSHFCMDVRKSDGNRMPLNTLILGHSICHRLHNYLKSGNNHRHQLDFNLTKTSTVEWHGVGGRTIHKMIKFDMGIVKLKTPKCVILLAGGNDVVEDTSVEEVAYKLISFCSILTNTYGVRRVVICAIMPRFPRDNFRFKKDGYNRDNTSVRDRAYKNMYFEKAQ